MASQQKASAKGVHPFLDLSTGHIKRGDTTVLDNISTLPEPDQPVVVLKRTHGWWIRIPALDIRATLAQCRRQGFSEMFIYMLRYAIKHECWWVHLDADAEIVDQLPLADW
jgi:hypothetical protein